MKKKNKFYSKTSKQTTILFVANLLLLAIGLLLKNIQTDILSPDDYGKYAFFTTVVSTIVLFFRFGFFDSLQVLLAQNSNEKNEKELIGTGIIFSLIIGILFSISIYFFSYFIDNIFNSGIKEILRLYSPLCFLFVFKQLIPSISNGTNRVESNPVSELISRLIFVILLIILPYYIELTLFNIVFLNIVTIVFSFIYTVFKFSPSFKNFGNNTKILFDKNKTFGFPLYVGEVAQQTTYKFDEIFVTYFVNTTQLGNYTLAKFIAMPMLMMSQALTTSLYKFFSRTKKIPGKVFIYNTLWLIFCILFLYVSKEFLVELIFGDNFKETIQYVTPITIALFFQGLYQPFTFLSAKSKGKEIRNIAFAEAAVNIIGNITLIPIFGVFGAIYTTILSKATNFLGLAVYYNKYLKKI